MATSSAIWQQAAHITYHLLAVQQETYKKEKKKKKELMFSWKILESFLGEKSQDRMDHKKKNDKTGRDQ